MEDALERIKCAPGPALIALSCCAARGAAGRPPFLRPGMYSCWGFLYHICRVAMYCIKYTYYYINHLYVIYDGGSNNNHENGLEYWLRRADT